ncbi:HAD family acid phosphatase [Streptomyces sp. VRA16 Mangrove soil]|uniref:HAD family acid phosphatase n=1 Tax=Streptomyces sp. VRA16 Mangrove soil TaxID=2817434 RepID=UPI001A9D9B8E|nr:HAD family acid phosphatase [Streptomyces sp. VRA16 Mangrove soil]MBO1335251.1 Secreted acid phosphatase [Streptomyces sp. VRA16 Mangrove soil]
MRRSIQITGLAAACALAGGVLYGAGAASAGHPDGTTTAEPHNIGLLVKEIKSYYGATQDAEGVWQASADSAYADDMAHIEAAAKKDIDKAAKKARKHGEKPAVVFDIDDTLLLSLDYEIKTNYVYNSASWASYVAQADRPAVPGTPGLVDYATRKGVEVFYNSGLKESQRASAVENLKKVGIDVNLDADHIFLKDTANPPAYLSACATAAAWNCTTVQYKSGTRQHIEDQGYDIVGNFGDQYSDLQGGHADKTYKFPNPTYYVE